MPGARATARAAGDTWAADWALHALAIGAMMQFDLSAAMTLYDQALATVAVDPVLDDLGLLLQVNRASLLGELGR
jgi:hypothetical protein